jgi:hypothetical protein
VNAYLSGNLVRVATYSGSISSPSGGFLDENGILADPTTVTLTYRPGPSSPLVSVTYPSTPVVRDAAGLYHADLDTTDAAATAIWTYEWGGTGTVQATAASEFTVTVPFL